MGNQSLKNSHHFSCNNMDLLCQAVKQDYNSPFNLSFNPFPCSDGEFSQEINFSINLLQMEIILQSMTEEGSETKIHQTVAQQAENQLYSQNYNKCLILQKNKILDKEKILKKKKIQKQAHKDAKRSKQLSKFQDNSLSFPQVQERMEGIVSEDIRNQNNCKSYHKLVRNYLYSKNLGHLIQPYEEQYHTRYYFIIALIIIKNHLSQQFTPIYQKIAEQEIQAQEQKINNKKHEISKIEERILLSKSQIALVFKRRKLLKQIDHIQVIKNEIGNYSSRSCVAFFQGKTEESLRILYMKNDSVMKKKYYFQEALQILKQIEIQLRKHSSHV